MYILLGVPATEPSVATIVDSKEIEAYFDGDRLVVFMTAESLKLMKEAIDSLSTGVEGAQP